MASDTVPELSMRPQRLAVFTPFPIQYQTPWFRALAEQPDLDVQVYFSRLLSASEQGDGFGRSFEWDLPLLKGYPHRVFPSTDVTFLSRYLSRPVYGITRELRVFKPDAALITGWQEFSLLQALAACRWAGVPVIMRGESRPKQRHWLARAAHRMLCARIDAFLVIGEHNRRFYVDAGVNAARLFDAPYFVDNLRFERAAATARRHAETVRADWGVPDGATLALFVGKLEAKKRPLDFIDAVAAASARGANLSGVVVGDGVLMGACIEHIRQLGAPVAMAGFRNQMQIAAAYAAADVLVIASDEGETWGLVVNEAMAAGLPVIASKAVGCVPDLVQDGVTGATYACGDLERLAALLVEASQDRPGWRDRGRAAQERVKQQHSVENSVAAVRRAMQRLDPRERSMDGYAR
jgi:glycosyltransferase involved in cell wall biosynthesis